MISPVFAQILRSGRDHFNAQFAAARHGQAGLDAEGFSQFLASALDPLVQAVAKVRPGDAAAVAMAGYEIALELAGLRLVGPGARQPFVAQAWTRLLPGVAALVANDPRRLLAALGNAVQQLATTPGARPGQWLDLMEKSGPGCPDVETWLKLGQVAAWRAGLAHFRDGALAVADTLPPALALAAVGASPSSRWPGTRDTLLSNAWLDPAEPATDWSKPRVVRQAGAFRGFGGLFATPPWVATSGGHLLAVSGAEVWVLVADAFGATFHRATAQEEQAAKASLPWPLGVKVSGSRVSGTGYTVDLPGIGELASGALLGNTLAVTAKSTYAVTLVALPLA